MLQMLRLHEEDTYTTMEDETEALFSRRTFWLLFITERFVSPFPILLGSFNHMYTYYLIQSLCPPTTPPSHSPAHHIPPFHCHN